jgi:hypothetical protein
LANQEVPEDEDPFPAAALEAVASSTEVHEGGRMVEGNAAPGQHLIILIQGIAKVNVDASAGPIRAGDSIVASGSGLAVNANLMSAGGNQSDDNANAREGAIESVSAEARVSTTAVVGRALEPLERGTGSIYVLVGVR